MSLLKSSNSTIASKKFKTMREYISAIRDTMIKRIDSTFVEFSNVPKSSDTSVLSTRSTKKIRCTSYDVVTSQLLVHLLQAKSGFDKREPACSSLSSLAASMQALANENIDSFAL